MSAHIYLAPDVLIVLFHISFAVVTSAVLVVNSMSVLIRPFHTVNDNDDEVDIGQ